MSPKREKAMVPQAEFRSYYGKPILKPPAWKVPDVPGYLFLGGLAGASATMAAAATLTGRPELAKIGHLAAAGGALGSVGALVHDLGRPERFLNMLRVFKVTSPLSVGSWILAPFSGLAVAAAGSQLTGIFPRLGALAGWGAGALGPAMCTYTAVLLADTAVPAWHEAHPYLPFVFAGSAMSSGAGMALVAAPVASTRPVVRVGLLGAAMETAALTTVERSLGVVSEPYHSGRPGTLLKAAKVLTATGAGLSLFGRRSRVAAVAAGAAYLAAGICTRFGVYHAGVESTKDPKYVVTPQRERLAARH
ncbi:NrfD/PsrC family molybdoenzyme membrane anchor subunit [Labedaea rhizosphaerae]|uniref:Formate-dependent nitrite reductase membrane component NrfD n=1 Tax=Labedaea rhizosphaerae TaxID=598644 RepID=A0A4V3CZT7_LABRH|nr:NrfD/PsrC family molybdoenzyme membrane anchor subunit [Labedaea rhizosphaerae]TDQ00991.1 formate-dependent nitrite reductase membrane component NrfD [Labedaea rhizosphaerae]